MSPIRWVAGGRAGFSDKAAPSIGESIYIAFIATLGPAGAGVVYGLMHPWGTRIGHQLRRLARLGSIALLLGVVVGVGRWIAAGSLGDDGIPDIVITVYFLVGGGLYALLGWNCQRAPARAKVGRRVDLGARS